MVKSAQLTSLYETAASWGTFIFFFSVRDSHQPFSIGEKLQNLISVLVRHQKAFSFEISFFFFGFEYRYSIGRVRDESWCGPRTSLGAHFVALCQGCGLQRHNLQIQCSAKSGPASANPWGDSLQRVSYCFALGLKSSLPLLHNNINANGTFSYGGMNVSLINRDEKMEAFHHISHLPSVALHH
ncbi:hypothetical protein Ddye_014260 [Dipteronia dyeriana]|uniref:Uncharacterized protein n=1 Tax=Dipteronia dyeriana TaxID=168575 RepID=A0AAD9X7U8_9ROSI|nr:hypothetical protein Ddye_014260 [Dipteronia dyeriana]